jgi:hypothetical protein
MITKGAIRSRTSNERQYNGQTKREKMKTITIIDITIHIKLNIE